MKLMNFPVLVFFFSFVALSFSVLIGNALRNRGRSFTQEERDDFGTVLGATLTLLALLIGFSFSMAVNRYDLRKNYEEAEANAIGTEFVRADLLPVEDTVRVRDLLKRYTDQRILFYTTRDRARLAKINAEISQLQNQLWSSVRSSAKLQPTPTLALAVSGMNDVLNSQGYTQAAWWNRIPIGAWTLMGVIAVVCCVMVGFGAHHRDWRMLLVVPLAVSIAFFLIADIDSPRGGAIRVIPQNLLSLSQSLQ